MFQTEVVQKIKTHLYCSKTLFRKRTVYEIIWEKYDRARKATDDNIIQRMRFACWITKVTNIHSQSVMLLVFHVNPDFTNAPQYRVVRTLPSCFVRMKRFNKECYKNVSVMDERLLIKVYWRRRQQL
jgi:hypothetical protein